MRQFITGYVLGPHGLDGTFKVKSASGEYAHIMQLKKVVLQGSAENVFDVESVQKAHGFALMKVRGIDSAQAAKTLSGSAIKVSEDAAHKCAKNEWYEDDLCGCDVMYGAEKAGTVVNIAQGAGCLLEVKINKDCALLSEKSRQTSRGAERRVMVPFTDEHIGDVDVNSKKMQLHHLWVLE